MTPLIPALALSFAGVVCLFLSWRGRREWTGVLATIGWLLVAASIAGWVHADGAEFGTAYAMIAVGFAAWSCVLAFGRETSRARHRHQQGRVPRALPTWGSVWQTTARAFVALPLAGAASLLLSVAAVAFFPWTAASRYAFAIGLAPVVWGVLASWVAMTHHLPRVAMLLAGVSAMCSVLFFIR
ncbi:MAG: hypothetical protein QM736_02560 [Vicinamibacterales bacterium]